MKRVILSALSVLALSGFVAPAAFAESSIEQKTAVVSSTLSRPTSLQLTPNSLVSSAFRGSYINQGIPSSAQLHHAYASGRVTAEGLVKVAIAAGHLSPETLSDTRYINTVDTKLASLDD
ncbi:MAG: hypothetical protein MUC48_16290 [Leptolyngbya sp. Prado105]|jgi:hypothetical protein|nr:hypothetical protein [Leptolyngbya sp. Prado105]